MIFALYSPVLNNLVLNKEDKFVLQFNKVVSKPSLESAMTIFIAYLSDPQGKLFARETKMEETLPYIENNYLSEYDKKMCKPVSVIYFDGFYHLVLEVNNELLTNDEQT